MRRSLNPGHRADLLDAAVQFVATVADVPGVRSVSLLGSIVTTRPDPNYIDLLLVVADDTDLSAVAGFARPLQGQVQQVHRCADIFLADERGLYLGRTCRWKIAVRASELRAMRCTAADVPIYTTTWGMSGLIRARWRRRRLLSGLNSFGGPTCRRTSNV